ncbi:MAG: class A beta-lactamase-related serine hydrolase [Acidobacteria bacterium]|nr:MAG: class A beta-lactamase-related serine hydrolase [Acidobacteriota bacterium]REK01657.1 MAG: class A beta-lactamase-related serine hydrolase [Acidobacteriota bacterium]REK14613.1 MAG: class A beta-lactamase-related serine hydrolase [Acidobacteriota bacterium]REK45328.1 MAG: class A beta-lactamase-related serine hydrolase [Acidobacteriota bacterium]
MQLIKETLPASKLVSPLCGILFTLLFAVSFPGFAQSIQVDKLAHDLEPEIRKAMIEGKIPSCTVALVSGDKVIWTGAFGESNLWARTPAASDSVYLIGSTFKAMSTVALLQLMEEGKFKLDDPVSDHLEFEIPGNDPANPITFRHLFTHTSGLNGEFGAIPVWNNGGAVDLDTYVRTKLKVDHPPVTKVEYSNPAFTLIGYLVEKISGVSYKQYIKENVWDPLEMTSTAFDPTPDMGERLAVPYVVNQETGKQVPTVRIRAAVYPAGITYGTIHDQANWMIMNLNGGMFKGRQIISKSTMDMMHTRQYDQFKGPIEGIWGNETAGFGLTWWAQERNGDQYFAHSGSLSGYTAFLLGNRDRKFGFAILTNGNRSHPHLFKLGDRAIDLMIELSAGSVAAKED